jgi:hypothetical protein
MTITPDFVVVRKTGLQHLDGHWFDRSKLKTKRLDNITIGGIRSVGLQPTGRFEFSQDGRCAEVWIPKGKP